MSDYANQWHQLLKRWPSQMPKEGVVQTKLNESVVFISFALDDHMAVFHRRAPDQMGARQVIIPYESISYLKITAIIPTKIYAEFGFEGTLPNI
ncbi:MAG: hypothetical protein COA78_26000 [Blastopirellula sp.]|nr:MAG: hypothetical protein COA78_26000 [Blastopirellula sp.]